MSKESKTVKMDPEAKAILDEQSKPKEQEVIENLKSQLSKFREAAEHYRKMAFKAEGALEVMLELNPEKEANEG